MKKHTYILWIALATAMLPGCSDDDQPDTGLIAESDRQFILFAADEALFQVNAGQVATSNASSKAVRDYGEEMTDDHTMAGQELQKIAGEKEIEIPTTLSGDRQQQLDSLSMRSGAGLDSLYLAQMVAAHNRVAHALEIQSAAGNDIGIKNWAAARLPVVRKFAGRAQAMRDSLN
jgi:putative membrane protein